MGGVAESIMWLQEGAKNLKTSDLIDHTLPQKGLGLLLRAEKSNHS